MGLSRVTWRLGNWCSSVDPSASHRVIKVIPHLSVGRDSSVGIATRYGLDGPGIENTVEVRFYSTVGSTQSPVKWVPGIFPGGKAAWAWA